MQADLIPVRRIYYHAHAASQQAAVTITCRNRFRGIDRTYAAGASLVLA